MPAKSAQTAVRKVLIVDDSRAILAILRRVVQTAAGPEVDVRGVTNADEALGLVATFLPDLIITDWHMPGVTGMHGPLRAGEVARARAWGADLRLAMREAQRS